MGNKIKFHHAGIDWVRIGVILAIFIGIICSMALLQLWIESHEVKGKNCELFDTGQFLFGVNAVKFMSGTGFSSIADIWVLVSVAGFFFWLGLDFRYPEREFGRFFLVWGMIYLQRAITIGATRYPLLNGNVPYVPKNPILGALLVTVGVMKTYSDFMFSGHTATWVVTAFFVCRYAHNRFLAWLYVVFNCVGPFLLIVVKEHYLADVLVGALVGLWTVVGYHLIHDDEFLAPFRGVWNVYLRGDEAVRIVYPITMKDAEGRKWTIGNNMPYVVHLVGGKTSPPRQVLWKLIKWFDGNLVVKPELRQEEVLSSNGNIQLLPRLEYNNNNKRHREFV